MAALISHSQATSPKGRAGHTFLAYGDNVILLGGYDDSGALDDIWMYDTSRDAWVICSYNRLNPHPLPRVDFDCCILKSKLYLFGGMQSDGEQVLIMNDLWSLDLDSGIWTMIMEECPVSERMGHVCVAVDNEYMLVHGGECMGKCFDDTWIYNANTNVWKTFPKDTNNQGSAPLGRCSHSACFQPESQVVLLFGGYTIEDGAPLYLNDLWAIEVSTLLGSGGGTKAVWKQVFCADSTALTPSPRDLPVMVALPESRLLIAGGFGLVEVDTDDAMMMEDDEAEGEAGIEHSYLGDFWMVEVDMSALSAQYTHMCTEEGHDDTIWASEDGRRGCKALVRPDGRLLSFGGFTGEVFSSTLESTALT